MELRAGLLGVATYLPPEIRRNDWWPCATVERWQRERTTLPPPAPRSEAMARVLAAMAEQALDPFGGVVERRVMPRDMAAVDMEARAAECAIANAHIDCHEI